MVHADTTITISGEVARLVDEAVASGGHASPNDAIRDALILYRERQEDDVLGLGPAEIDRLIDEADASGPPGEIDFEEIKREARRRVGAPPAEA